jgi:hypothetical protein
MNRAASLTLTGLLSGIALTGQAGVDEPAVTPVSRIVRPSTALDDGGVRALDAPRKLVPAIEQDVVLPEPRAARRTRSADDEVVLPGGPGFLPERALDDAFIAPRPARRAVDKAPTVPAHPSAAARKGAAEDPAGRASETGKPSRKGNPER